MGMMTFQLPANLPPEILAELERTTIAGGQDCMPYPTQVHIDPQQMVVHRQHGQRGRSTRLQTLARRNLYIPDLREDLADSARERRGYPPRCLASRTAFPPLPGAAVPWHRIANQQFLRDFADVGAGQLRDNFKQTVEANRKIVARLKGRRSS